MTKQELEFNKLNTLSILTSPQKWVRSGIPGSYKTVIRWGDKWEFECESNMRRFTTESIFEAVDWFYADVDIEEDFYKEESKPNLDETYELEAKDDKEQSELALAIGEAERKAKIEVLTELRTRYTDLYNECAKVGGEPLALIKFKMDIYQDFIRDIEKILEDLE